MNSIYKSNINKKYKFKNFIEGKSNKFVKTLTFQIANKLDKKYNPLFIYGSTGVGKTHLLNAIGNKIISKNNNIKVVYINSERFVQYMVMALKNNKIENFKKYYRSVNVLLLDDIQFFANKKRSQEEFFHTFNTLLEDKQQIILTSNKHPKALKGLKNKLISRFECGLTMFIKPPDLKTRIKIIIKKTKENNIILSNETAEFIAKYIKTNVREIEGALNRIIAKSNFEKSKITINFVKNVLKDIIFKDNKLITIKKIQKTIAKYYKIKTNDMISKCKIKSITIPRQIAMIVTKKLTNYSLSKIGNSFGKRNHTTVLYACKKIKKLCKENYNLEEDLKKIIKKLSY
ncbi:chromosomal replication initiator protein DnaA [Candidatus Purcelliella pentastirinorum]|uniref:chromosomal replication initiator protein DnaA n=1 Tax=Candidatus Purcelliella pentastirinorum TaxID=472834 RepID=UPI0039F6FAE2